MRRDAVRHGWAHKRTSHSEHPATVNQNGLDKAARRRRRVVRWGVAAAAFVGATLIAPSATADLLGIDSIVSTAVSTVGSATNAACATAANAGNALGSVSSTSQFLLCNLTSVVYTVHTEYVPTPGAAPIVHDTPGVLGSVTPVFATGGLAPDLTASILPTGTGSGIGLRVDLNKTGNAPATFPVSVEVILTAPPSVGIPRANLSWGYDAKSDSAPDQFHTTFLYELDANAAGDPGIAATFGTHYADEGSEPIGAPANPSQHALTLIGGVFNGTPETRTLPVAARVKFAPAFDGDTTFGLDFGKTALTAHYATNPNTWLIGAAPNPTVVTTDINGEQPSPGVDSIAIHGNVGDPTQPASSSNSMPQWVNVVYDQPNKNTTNNDTLDVHYSAATPIASLGASVNIVTGGVPNKVTADAQGVPTAMDVNYNNPDADTMNVTYTGSAPMKQLNATFDGKTGTNTVSARVNVTGLPTFLAIHKRLITAACSGTPQICTPAQPETEFTTTPTTPLAVSSGPVDHIDATVHEGDPASFVTPAAPPNSDQGVSYDAIPAGSTQDFTPYGPSTNVRVVVDGLSKVDYKEHVGAIAATAEVPAYVNVIHAGGPFDLHSAASGATVEAHIDYLPSSTTIQAWTDQNKFQYDGGAPPTGQSLPTITADIAKGPGTVHAVITHLPGEVVVKVDPTRGFIWHASSILDRVQATVDNVPGVPNLVADVQGVPTDFTIGLDSSRGLGLLDGASSAVKSASILVGTDQWPAAIAPAAGSNAVYFNPQTKSLALQVFNLQGGWIDQGLDRLTSNTQQRLHVVLGPRQPGSAAPTLQATIQGTGASGPTTLFAPGSPQFAGVRIGSHGLPDRLDLALILGLPRGSRISYNAYTRCSASAASDPSGFCPAAIPGDLDLALTSASDSTDVGNVNESGLEAIVGNLPPAARLCVGTHDDCDFQYFDRGAAWGSNAWDNWMCTQWLGTGCDPTGWVENPLLSPGGTNNDYTVKTDPDVVLRIATDPGLATPIHLKALVSCSNSSASHQDFYNRPAYGGFGNCLNNMWVAQTLNSDGSTTTPVLLPNWGPNTIDSSQDASNAFLNDYHAVNVFNASLKNLDFMVQTGDLPKHIIGGGTSGTASIVHMFVNTWGDHVTAERIQLGAATKSIVVDNLDMTTPATGHGKQWLVETSLPPNAYLHDGTLYCGDTQSFTASGFLPLAWLTGSNFLGLQLCN